ncbi:Maf family protein [Tropicimonas sp. TH_r6]|uniref:Maf family protein n=1 Tax=Tropicimonas sp. TH_r6 TaxID=3082085 RepID=UPI0029548987|nr:Maf family protein [Tropicimonas sp. TH_r6]MDV7141280.1 Maf family protein [Tropicimonas sp. TH_r6]
MPNLVLASASEIRAQLLRNAGLGFETARARIDEDSLRRAMEAEGVSPRDMADHLAESKAFKIATRQPDALVLGCDQILEFENHALAKPNSEDDAVQQILSMSGQTHFLHSAAILIEAEQVIWRHVATVRLTMRSLSKAYVEDYVARNWSEIRHCVGAYQLEAEGSRLFTRIEGDYFSVLGLPLLPLLDHLALRGVIET